VIAHGGLIGVNNRPEGGAEFYFVLPMEEALPELEAEVHEDG
jgi:two-component system, OmpR family, sensor histidine kinase KdpD